MASEKLATASVLAFERKLDVSDGLFSAGKWDDRANSATWKSLEINEKSVRGTISNRLKSKDTDPAKLDAMIEKPNLQTVDVAALPADADTLCVNFSMRVLGGAGIPSACNVTAYRNKLKETVDGYIAEHGFKVLSDRYAYNIASGRFLWRNRVGAEEVEVVVNRMNDGKVSKTWKFNSFDHALADFNADANVSSLGDVVCEGLSGDSFVLLDVFAYVRMGWGQEVFPSQELIMEKTSGKGGKSKTLYQVGNVAAMHSQKIGNAVRTIDTWYTDFPESPIAVEPYGSVTSLGCAYRQPKDKTDFYNLLDGWILRDKKPDVNQQHFVMAVFVRGGVFGDSEKE